MPNRQSWFDGHEEWIKGHGQGDGPSDDNRTERERKLEQAWNDGALAVAQWASGQVDGAPRNPYAP